MSDSTGNTTSRFRKGLIRLSCQRTFTDKQNGRVIQYAGLYAGGRLLSTGDLVEEDAEVVARLFNESVLRRLAAKRKKKGPGE